MSAHPPSEDVGMAVAHFCHNSPGHAVEIEAASFRGHLSMKHDLEKQVSQFIFQLVHIAGLDGIRNFVCFLDGVGRDRGKGLLTVPWAAVFNVAETSHNLEEVIDSWAVFWRSFAHDLKIVETSEPFEAFYDIVL